LRYGGTLLPPRFNGERSTAAALAENSGAGMSIRVLAAAARHRLASLGRQTCDGVLQIWADFDQLATVLWFFSREN
jgi:hypothetical protein